MGCGFKSDIILLAVFVLHYAYVELNFLAQASRICCYSADLWFDFLKT